MFSFITSTIKIRVLLTEGTTVFAAAPAERGENRAYHTAYGFWYGF
jgi:hypothetical protein